MKPIPEQPQSAVVADDAFMADDRRIAQALDEYLSEIEAGRAPDRQALQFSANRRLPDTHRLCCPCPDGVAC
jgi:hypothetical protein